MEFNVVREKESLYDFLSYQGFNDTVFQLSLHVWIDIITTNRDDWFVLTDELIRTLGYKRRTVLLKFLRSHFIDSTDYVVINTRITRVTRNGEYHKRDIRMRKRSFTRLLVKLDTNVSRDIYEYMCTVYDSIHKYDLYNKECELHRTDEFIRELRNEHECIILLILGYMSFVIFVTMMYFLV